jgi:hypothetical protein
MSGGSGAHVRMGRLLPWVGMIVRSRAVLGLYLAALPSVGQAATFAEATSPGADANIAGDTIIPKVFP